MAGCGDFQRYAPNIRQWNILILQYLQRFVHLPALSTVRPGALAAGSQVGYRALALSLPIL